MVSRETVIPQGSQPASVTNAIPSAQDTGDIDDFDSVESKGGTNDDKEEKKMTQQAQNFDSTGGELSKDESSEQTSGVSGVSGDRVGLRSELCPIVTRSSTTRQRYHKNWKKFEKCAKNPGGLFGCASDLGDYKCSNKE
ncbi:hypothetical protein PC129_g16030 [Phytophthora cactorum]|uniref:Uncharacterized protein n=1 Tax=Phytophthora cactorum TaxID=29920 RepID=A0A329S5F5_9STRA|nr:hypothetical protein Pcac1_g19005 [Phytophthora cactorum]KAG2803565.1 hypothetical protein PC112_g19117 [Phytophthora cactorum]KAG2823349.1 hypothetical protein PC111_g10254 [Phytophthora cactorum]KAG2855879.1 hypothetical protein PC113_g12056 [Phytophthora cactorum]KAG2886185.1 hypothetical protein PC114_g19389 [Phytophthora cactorum]